MKNLENYGVQELSVKEQREIDGGFPWLIAVLVVAFIVFALDGNDNTQAIIGGKRVGK